MRDFFDFIQPASSGYVEVRSIRDGRVRQWWETDRQAAVDLMIRQSDEGWDAYYGVLPRTAMAGDAENIADQVSVLWADLDAKEWDKGLLLQHVSRYQIPPSVVVDSGHGYHVYWRLGSEAHWETARLAMIGLARKLKGDHVYDKPRILRLPGTTNWKDKGNPLPVRALVFNTTALYRIQDFHAEQELGLAATEYQRTQPRAVAYVPPAERNDLPDWLEDLIRDGVEQGSRSEASWKVMSQLAQRGWSDAEIKAAFEQGGIGDKMREQRDGERWFNRSLTRARARL